ncbi:MAG: hypothetical protein Q9223_004996 [Gallowayella weberi]
MPNGNGFYKLTISAFGPPVRLQIDDISNAAEAALTAFKPGNLAHRWPYEKAGGNIMDRLAESSAVSVKLVDVDDLRNTIGGGLIPDFFGLCLDTCNSIKDADCTIQDPQGPDNLKSKICMSGGIYKINYVMIFGRRGQQRSSPLLCLCWIIALLRERGPMEGDCSRLDGDTSLSLRWKEIRDSGAIVDIYK